MLGRFVQWFNQIKWIQVKIRIIRTLFNQLFYSHIPLLYLNRACIYSARILSPQLWFTIQCLILANTITVIHLCYLVYTTIDGLISSISEELICDVFVLPSGLRCRFYTSLYLVVLVFHYKCFIYQTQYYSAGLLTT